MNGCLPLKSPRGVGHHLFILVVVGPGVALPSRTFQLPFKSFRPLLFHYGQLEPAQEANACLSKFGVVCSVFAPLTFILPSSSTSAPGATCIFGSSACGLVLTVPRAVLCPGAPRYCKAGMGPTYPGTVFMEVLRKEEEEVTSGLLLLE